MEFLVDNCVRQIKCPVGILNRFDYNSKLNLIASIDYKVFKLTIWNPDTGEVVADDPKIDLKTTGCAYDVLFLTAGYIAVLYSETGAYYRPFACVALKGLLSGEDAPGFMTLTGSKLRGDDTLLALTHKSDLLANTGVGTFTEFPFNLEPETDADNALNIIHVPEGIPEYETHFMWCLCCSRSSYDVYYFMAELRVPTNSCIKCLHVGFSPDGEAKTTEETITHCFIKGEKREFGFVTGLAHDGENLIVATGDKITVLESATDGSIGHVIVSSGLSMPSADRDHYLPGQLRVRNDGQLMVCDGSDVIRVYQYKVNNLQGLCRQQINTTLKYNRDKVEGLPIPKTMKDYLLYKA